MQWKCSICGEVLRTRAGSVDSVKTNFIQQMTSHMWKKHRNTMIRRIKAGKRASEDFNPTVQDFISALKSAPERAVTIYIDFTEAQYQHIKKMMDIVEPVLPIEVSTSWKLIEALHDKMRG